MKNNHSAGYTLTTKQRVQFEKVWKMMVMSISVKTIQPPIVKLTTILSAPKGSNSASFQPASLELKERLITEEEFIMRAKFLIPVKGKTDLHSILIGGISAQLLRFFLISINGTY